jgi:D-alanyl-lipoteichoic acid acyltransferase DltB (MBOAT superfamily)
LFLLVFSTLLDYFAALQIQKNNTATRRKIILWICISINLGFLGVFKYYNFFADSLSLLLSNCGINANPVLLNIILPVGISFYTFHGLSYIIDIYYKRINAETNFVDYSLFVSYFPLLVAGPIERATHLLPQIKVKRNFDFDKAKQGVYQIIWGLVKKIVIADSCAVYANQIFDHYQTMNSLSLILGAVYFAFQIYGDFSGYSDIALGTSKLFGIDLLKNFDFPYFSRDIAEFWRKWHISLSSWFKDYVYIPLGGSSGSLRLKIRNTFIIFLISGFWHGANWTYVAWGFVNALYFLPLLVLKQNRKNIDSIELKFNFNALKNIFKILFTFAITCFAWIFFRSKTLTDAFLYIQKMVSNWEFKEQYFAIERYNNELVYLLLLFIVVEWNFKGKIEPISGNYSWLKLTLCIAAIIALGIFSDSKEFIYFQF